MATTIYLAAAIKRPSPTQIIDAPEGKPEAGGRGRVGRALSPLFSEIRLHCWFGTELQLERRVDLEVTQQEGPLVEPSSAQPAGDLVVHLLALASTATSRTLPTSRRWYRLAWLGRDFFARPSPELFV